MCSAWGGRLVEPGSGPAAWPSTACTTKMQWPIYGCIVTESLEGDCVVDSAVDGAAGAAKRCKKGDVADAIVAGNSLSLMGAGFVGPPVPDGADDVADATASVEDDLRRVLGEPDLEVVEVIWQVL